MTWDTDRLAELVSQKCQLLQTIQELVVRQEELVERSEMTALFELLAVKQRMLDQLQTVERQLTPFRDQEPESRSWRSAQLRDQTAASLERSQQLLADILQREKRCEMVLLQRREETANQLRSLCTSGEMLAAYRTVEAPQQSQLNLVSGE